jgi:hypothetical protein
MQTTGRARSARRIGRRLRGHVRANVVGYLALFVALGGTGAWAAEKVTSNDIARNAVHSKHIANRHVRTPDLANGAVTAPKLGCRGNGSADKMVRVGSVCIDKYENSIWTKKTGGQPITGAIPCGPNGQDCKGKIFARSVRGVAPRGEITWFQAQQALANSGKRLPTSAEWQAAVAGTPDGAPCRVSGGSALNTGAAIGCVSDWGANDMVGNLSEWVADWVPQSTGCSTWEPFSDDAMCLSGAAIGSGAPGVLIRGGDFEDTTVAGPLKVLATNPPQAPDDTLGFRGGR